MPRYFIEVSYKGTAYSGFQVQKNAITIQSEVEKALQIYFKQPFSLTGASRTDAGVHALQNYFHFDIAHSLNKDDNTDQAKTSKEPSGGGGSGKAGFIYNLNAILPADIVIKRIFGVEEKAHCRFDAISREYRYVIYRDKNPFLHDRAYYFPYKTDMEKMNRAAALLLNVRDFTSFSKRSTQVNNFLCEIKKAVWVAEDDTLVFKIKANRFLRGMVKGLVGTMLKVGTGKLSIEEYRAIIESRDCTRADFSVPSMALFLVAVVYR